MNEAKAILLIAPKYFGYDELLRQYMLGSGVEVDLLPDRPVDSSAGKAVIRLSRNVAMPFADRFFKKQIGLFGRKRYDAVLVIQGEGVSPAALRWIRVAYPSSSLVWYLWDSFDNKPALKENLPYFDHVYTFDPKDARDYGTRWRPLFFSPAYEHLVHETKQYDLCFIGTGHEDRFPIVQSIKRLYPDKSFYSFLYMQSRLLYAYRRLSDRNLLGAKRSDFSFLKMPQEQVQQMVSRTDVVVDVQHPAQRGLTMRTLETLGARKKLITTNAEIKDYDFFDPNNILVIDRKKPYVPEDFFERKYSPIASDTFEKYSVRGFTQSLLGEKFFRPVVQETLLVA